MCYSTLARVVELAVKKTTCRRRDAPLDAKSSRASLSHTSRREITRRSEDWLAPSRGEKKWGYLSGKGTPACLAYRSRFITAPGRRATLSPRGSIPRVRRKGNQSGKKLNITPEYIERLCAKPGFSLRRSKNFGPFGLTMPSPIQLSSLPLEISPKKKRLCREVDA